MSYIRSKLFRVSGSAAKVTRWMYLTTDSLAAVMGTNYFSDAGSRGAQPGDPIDIIIYSTMSSIGEFSGFLSYNLTVFASVSTNGGTTAPIASAGGLSGPNSQNANYSFKLSDLGGVVVIPSGSGAGIVLTVPPTSSVAWPTGYVPAILIDNQCSNSVSVAGGAGVTLNRRDGTSGTGTRTVGANSKANLLYFGSIALDNWDVDGSALS